MSPPRLLLIRHGQTSWNVERRVLGRTDIPLDEEGLRQAAALAAILEPVHTLWASPLSRARSTAEAVAAAQSGVALQIEPDLTEMDQGEMDGCGEAEMRARFAPVLSRWNVDPTDERLPGGETLREVQERGLAALARIAAATPEGATVAVVSHQLLISAVLCGLRGEPLSGWRGHAHKNTAWSEVRWGPIPEVVATKLAPHLDPPR